MRETLPGGERREPRAADDRVGLAQRGEQTSRQACNEMAERLGARYEQ